MTKEGDVVLVYIENQPGFFARIESITPDIKPEWFRVKMLVLQIPLMVITWILREPYINGEEFTIGGVPMRMVKVVAPQEESEVTDKEGEEQTEERKPKEPPTKGKVISFTDRKPVK